MKFLLLPLLAFAAPEQFQVQSKLFIGDKLVASPRLVVNSGKEAWISDSGKESALNLRITPERAPDGKIIMSLHVDYTSGRRKVETNQRIAVNAGEEVDLNLGNDSSLKLTVKEN
jgi:hypothetical protein